MWSSRKLVMLLGIVCSGTQRFRIQFTTSNMAQPAPVASSKEICYISARTLSSPWGKTLERVYKQTEPLSVAGRPRKKAYKQVRVQWGSPSKLHNEFPSRNSAFKAV